jgi:hypothetical protein
MASFVYNTGMSEVIDNTIDIDTDTLKVMLVTASYVADQDDDVVDAGGANDAIDHEINVTGYTPGWGNSGRKTPSVAVVANKTDNRVDIGVQSDLTWTALGSGATIAAAILIKEGGANDTTSRLICYWDVTDTATNGGDITLDFTVAASGGNIRLST